MDLSHQPRRILYLSARSGAELRALAAALELSDELTAQALECSR